MPLPSGRLLLAYRIPPRPTSGRVLVWRRLQKMGAEKLLDSVWSLPDTSDHEHHLVWLAQEIRELGGEATVFRAAEVAGGRKAAKAPKRKPTRRTA